jgi:hypothetical protein
MSRFGIKLQIRQTYTYGSDKQKNKVGNRGCFILFSGNYHNPRSA